MQVGQEVICVDDSTNKLSSPFFQEWVKEGTMYTIRRVEPSLGGTKRILLDQLRNEPVLVQELGGKAEPGFSSHRFTTLDGRPLEEVEYEIEKIESV